MPINEPRLEEALEKLEQARTWSPRVISKLETVLRTGDDEALFRINPLQYAAERGMKEPEAVELFLHGTRLGLFEMEWHSICGSCGHVVTSLRSMNGLHSHYVCTLCAYEATGTLDDYIQVAFTIAPSIRAITFHQPATLSAEDFCLRYSLCRNLLPPPGFERYTDFMLAATQLMTYVEPGERRTLSFDTARGLVVCIDLLNSSTMQFITSATAAPETKTIEVHWAEGRLNSSSHALHPARIDFGYSAFAPSQYIELPSGPITFEFENRMSRRGLIWVSHFKGEPPPPGSLGLAPFLSGKQLITTQTFRDLFRSETVASDESLGIKDITILFTDLKGSTALYDTIGDPKAYFLVRQHFEALTRVVNHYAGATIKTIGDAVMATFMTPLDASRAALEMLRAIAEFNRTITDQLTLKIGIHRGHSIVVTLNERLDYFGQTVNIAARVQALAEANEVYVSDAVYQHPGVASVFAECQVTPEEVNVKGVSEKLQVYKIRP